MTNLEEIDKVADLWNKTRDEKYRALWYKKNKRVVLWQKH